MKLEEINKNLSGKIVKWKKMKDKSEDKKESANFYEEEIMPLAVSKFVKTQQKKYDKKYQLYIATVGRSYEPIIYSLLTLNPDKILFLVTEESEKKLDKIVKFTGIRISQFRHSLVDPNRPVEVYKEIKKIYTKRDKPQSVAIDFTGGTKAMTGGAAMAGSIIGADVFYVANNEYLPESRRPKPGSEYLVKVSNPYDVFGDLELDKVLALWDKYNYGAAADLLQNILKKVSGADKYIEFNFLFALASAYKCWDEFNFELAEKNMNKVLRDIEQFKIYERYLSKLEEQKKIIQSLKKTLNNSQISLKDLQDKRKIKNLIFVLYTSALRQEELQKYDLAALLLYRIQEMMEQRRLALYDINPANPELSQKKEKEYLEKMNQIAEKKKPLYKIRSFPDKISNLKGYILLSALDDPLVDNINWQRFIGTMNARNNSIFARGYQFIKDSTFKSFKMMVNDILNKFCEIEKINKGEMIDKCKFIEL
ncbi:MAG: TIGR02710 family CRISPR-associated CARF protein [Halanaerobiales bacterium]